MASVPESDWLGRARREAAAIIEGANPVAEFTAGFTDRRLDRLIALVAAGWLQGAIYGSHCTLEHAEDAFAAMREKLT